MGVIILILVVHVGRGQLVRILHLVTVILISFRVSSFGHRERSHLILPHLRDNKVVFLLLGKLVLCLVAGHVVGWRIVQLPLLVLVTLVLV